jgi:hypothetical protein
VCLVCSGWRVVVFGVGIGLIELDRWVFCCSVLLLFGWVLVGFWLVFKQWVLSHFLPSGSTSVSFVAAGC